MINISWEIEVLQWILCFCDSESLFEVLCKEKAWNLSAELLNICS